MYQVNSMLADMARVANGKLDLWGGGWSIITPGSSFAVCGKIDLPWHQRQQAHTLRLDLLDTDGNPVLLPNGQAFSVSFPDWDPAGLPELGIKPGTPIDWRSRSTSTACRSSRGSATSSASSSTATRRRVGRFRSPRVRPRLHPSRRPRSEEAGEGGRLVGRPPRP